MRVLCEGTMTEFGFLKTEWKLEEDEQEVLWISSDSKREIVGSKPEHAGRTADETYRTLIGNGFPPAIAKRYTDQAFSSC